MASCPQVTFLDKELGEIKFNNFARVYCSPWAIPACLKSLCITSFTRLLSSQTQASPRAQSVWGRLLEFSAAFCPETARSESWFLLFHRTSLILNYLFPYYFLLWYTLQVPETKEEKEKGRQRRRKAERRLLNFFTSFESETIDDICVPGHSWQSSITCKGLCEAPQCHGTAKAILEPANLDPNSL